MFVSQRARALLEYACLFNRVERRFPSIEELCEMFGVREAELESWLKQLFNARLIWRDYQTGGIYLAKRRRWWKRRSRRASDRVISGNRCVPAQPTCR